MANITADIDFDTVSRITAADNNMLTIHYKDGLTETRQWKDRSRSKSWTSEMKEAARKKTAERSSK